MTGTPTLTRRAALSLPLALSLSSVASRPARAAPIRVADVLGRTVELPRPAERAIVGFYTDEYSAITGRDGWDKAVGFAKRQWAVNRTSTWERYRIAVPRLDTLPDVGDWEDETFSAEKVLALRADLVIVPPWAMTQFASQMQPIQAAGVPVVVVDYNAQDPAKHAASTLAIGAAMGTLDRARELADLYTRRVEDTRARALATGRSPKVYFELGQAGPGTFANTYKKTMWGKMVDLIGANNIANEALPVEAGFQPVAPEKILAAQPDHIFLSGAIWAGKPNSVRLGFDVSEADAKTSLRPYLNRPGWVELPAVKTGNVHAVEASLARSLKDWVALQFIAKQLHPEAFADVDPVSSLKSFFADWLPVPFSGTWMASLK